MRYLSLFLIVWGFAACYKPWSPLGGDPIQLPLIPDSVMKSARAFTLKRWRDDGSVHKSGEQTVMFDIFQKAGATDSATFRKGQGNTDARAADSTVFLPLKNRQQMRANVTMQFNYVITDTVNKKNLLFSYSYPLSDSLFNYP